MRRFAPLLLLAVGGVWFGLGIAITKYGLVEAILTWGGLGLIVAGLLLGAWRLVEGFRF